jgi:opacity protein-like surface antigen
MKKFLTVLAVLAIATTLTTTASAEMNLEVGAKGGINLADMWGEDADSIGTDTSFRVGFLGGAFLGASFNETFGARLEILYAQRGQKINDDAGDITVKLDYIEIALYAVGSFAAGEKGTVYVMGGPYFGFNSVAEISNGATVDIEDQIASSDFGLGVGAGYGFMATDMLKIFLEGQYNIGFISVDDTEDDLTINNHGVGITAGVAIPLSSNGGGM